MKRINIKLTLAFLLASLYSFSQTAVTGFGTNPGNINGYKYVPANMPANAPLVVVLHGCTQTATSYAAETAWNTLAAAHKFYVVYGEQKSANNSNSCFNYWEAGDVTRGQGEALSVKQLVDHMKSNYSIDSARVFVTGLSAGGAMTAVMAATYPEIFAAAAEMAGLPYKVATNSTAVYLAAVGQVTKTAQQWGDLVRAENPGYTGNWPRMAVFHGTSDIVINDANGTEMIKQFTNLHGSDQTADYTNSTFNGNSSVQLEQYFNADRRPVVVRYKVTGMAHGTAVDPGSCYQQGGTTTSLSFDVDFYSCFWAAQFFGILQLPYSITGPISVSNNQQGIVFSVPQTAGSTYAWLVPSSASIVSGQGSNSITVNWGNKNGTVSVTETPTGGCKKGPVEVFVTAGAAAPSLDANLNTLTVPASQVCTNSFSSSFTLTNSGQTTLANLTIYYKLDNGSVQTYPWNGSLAAAQSTVVTLPVITPGTGSHTLHIFSSAPNSGSDGNNGNDTIVKTFTAGTTPTVSLGNDIVQCGSGVNLNAQNAGAIFAWSTGASSQTLSVSQSGNYAVTVTSNGCSASDNISVTLNSNPVVSLGTGGAVCAVQQILDAGNAGASFLWSTGATTQTITATQSNTYSVTVTKNGCTATDDVSITLNTPPVVSLGNGGNVCAAQYALDAGNPGSSFVWSTGASSQIITVTQNGSYSVTVTKNGCSVTDNISITFGNPVVALGAGGSFCDTQHTLDAGNPNSTYVWSNGETTQTISATSSGTYSVTISAGPNCTATGSVSITLNTPPSVSLQLTADTVCSTVGIVALNGGSPAGGIFSGNYINAGVFDAGGAGVGTYAVTYTYTDNNSCAGTATQNLAVVTCTSTAISNVADDIGLSFYPNPATDMLQVLVKKLLPGMQLKIIDVAGKTVMAKTINEQHAQINIAHLSKGMYVMSIEAGGMSTKETLVIE